MTLKLLATLLGMLVISDSACGATNANIYETVLDTYLTAASGWAAVGFIYGGRLFWSLVVISMIWTFGIMGLRKADIGEFFAEFFKFTVTTGFFWWLLTNGPTFGLTIIRSLRQIGGEATGLGADLTPSRVADIGFDLFFTTLDKASMTSPLISLTGIVLGLFVLMICAWIGAEMLLLLIASWTLLFGGVFFLGFGGSRWTSSIALNYYKTVAGMGASLLAMTLIIGVGSAIIDQYYATMSNTLDVKGLTVVLVVAFVMLRLVDRVPPLISGLIAGAGVGGHGGLGFSAGAAIGGAAGLAAGAIGTAVSMTAAGMTGAAGGASALSSAVKMAGENTAAGTDIVSRMGGAMVGGMSRSFGGGSGGGYGGGSNGPGRSVAEQMGMGMQSAAQAVTQQFRLPNSEGTGVGQGGGGSGSSSGGRKSANDAVAKGSGQGFGSTGSSGGGYARGEGGGQGSGGGGKATGGQRAGAEGGSAKAQGSGGGLLGVAASVGRVAADAMANLAVGTWDVGAAKAGAVLEGAQERIGQTVGGQIATTIRARGTTGDLGDEAPSFDGNSLAGAANDTAVDAAAEVAAFRDRKVFW